MIFSLWGLHVIILNNRMIKETQISNKLKQISCFFRDTWLDSEALSSAWYLSRVRLKLRALVGLLMFTLIGWFAIMIKLHLQTVLYGKLNTVFPRISAHAVISAHPLGQKHQTSAPSPPPSLSLIHIVGVHGKPVSIATLLITLCVNCRMGLRCAWLSTGELNKRPLD